MNEDLNIKYRDEVIVSIGDMEKTISTEEWRKIIVQVGYDINLSQSTRGNAWREYKTDFRAGGGQYWDTSYMGKPPFRWKVLAAVDKIMRFFKI